MSARQSHSIQEVERWAVFTLPIYSIWVPSLGYVSAHRKCFTAFLGVSQPNKLDNRYHCRAETDGLHMELGGERRELRGTDESGTAGKWVPVEIHGLCTDRKLWDGGLQFPFSRAL